MDELNGKVVGEENLARFGTSTVSVCSITKHYSCSAECMPIQSGICSDIFAEFDITHHITVPTNASSDGAAQIFLAMLSEDMENFDGHQATCAKLLLLSSCVHSHPPCDAHSGQQVGFCQESCTETISKRLELCRNTTDLSFALKYTNATNKYIPHIPGEH